jgi:hypothetical protein
MIIPINAANNFYFPDELQRGRITGLSFPEKKATKTGGPISLWNN